MHGRSLLPLSLLLSAMWLAAGCVLRPGLEGRACDDDHGCVEGFHCSAGVCVEGAAHDAGAVPRPRDPDGGLADAGHDERDGGEDPRPDGGAPDAGPDDGGVPLPDAGPNPPLCVDEPADDSWFVFFRATPPVGKPGGRVEISWLAPDMDECRLISPFFPPAPFPANAEVHIDVGPTRSSTFVLRCEAGAETYEAALVVPVGPAVLDVEVDGHRTCVVVEGGVVRCWGDLNGNFSLGGTDAPKVEHGTVPSETGDNLPRISLADENGREPRATQLYAGRYHVCARLDDGRLKCWGLNENGQLGIESTTSYWPSIGWDDLPDARLSRVANGVALGGHHTCVSFDDGDVGCFGPEGFGRLGAPRAGGLGGAPGTMGDALPTLTLDDEAGVAALAAGWTHTCALLDDGRVKCWGGNHAGQLGLGDTATRGDAAGEVGPSSPAVDLGGAVAAVDASGTLSCALLDDDSVKCWGENVFGALGQGTDDDLGDEPGEMGAALLPVALGSGVTPAQLAVGDSFACVVTTVGAVKCWGNNASGQLGLGDVENRGDGAGEMGDDLPFVDVGGGVRELDLGSSHTCALLADGRLKCWGDNRHGQLGLGDDDNRGDGPGEMGGDLPAVDVGSFVEEMFTLDGAMAALAREGCTSCHTRALPAASRASPPLDGCAPELVDDDTYSLGGLDPTSPAGAARCFAWHVTEECVDGDAGASRRVDPSRPEHSLLLRAPGLEGHPTTGRFSSAQPGSDHAYLFHWIARGAPAD